MGVRVNRLAAARCVLTPASGRPRARPPVFFGRHSLALSVHHFLSCSSVASDLLGQLCSSPSSFLCLPVTACPGLHCSMGIICLSQRQTDRKLAALARHCT